VKQTTNRAKKSRGGVTGAVNNGMTAMEWLNAFRHPGIKQFEISKIQKRR
jgi:hypothetical protein